jgi:hypothetical protein
VKPDENTNHPDNAAYQKHTSEFLISNVERYTCTDDIKYGKNYTYVEKLTG